MASNQSPLASEADIVVVVPAYNEEEGIGPTLEEIRLQLEGWPEDPQYMVVDGGSRDRTPEIAKSLGVQVIGQWGRGKGDAFRRAVELLNGTTEYIVIIDADFTYPARHIPEMLRLIDSDPSVGMVCGNRFNNHFDLGKAMKNRLYLGNRMLSLTQRILNGIRMQDPFTGLRVIRYKLVKDWVPKSRGFDIEAELNFLVQKSGYRIEEIPIEYRRRLGNKKLQVKHGFTIARRILIQAVIS